jgi:uncharacterized protein
MADVFEGFTLRGPGVFIQELEEERPFFIGVFPSNLGVVGFTRKGPVNKPTLVSSFDEFVSKFGNATDPAIAKVWLTVRGYFDNGGTRAYVVRIVPSNATKASGVVDTNKWTFTTLSEGAWGNNIRVVISGNPDFKDLVGKKWDKFDITVEEKNEFGIYEAVEKFLAVDLIDDNAPDFITKVVNDERSGSELISVTKGTGGVPSALIKVDVTDDVIGSGDGSTTHFAGTLSNVPVLETTVVIKVGTSTALQDDGLGRLVGTGTFTGSTGTIDYDTGAFVIDFSTPPPAGTNNIKADYTKLAKSTSVVLSGGSDGTVSSIGRNELTHPNLAPQNKGIYAFNLVDDVINLAVPDLAGNPLAAQDQIAYAEQNRFVYVVLTTPSGFSPKEAANYVRISLNRASEFAALYYPWVKVIDPISGSVIVFPPLGHVIGVYAKVDRAKSVGKAPAGLDDGLISGVVGVERNLTREDIDNLYTSRVNPIVNFAATGVTIFGARNLTFDVKTRYIQTRRTLIFVEKVLSKLLEALLFESVGEALFSRIRITMTSILSTFFKQGMFFGATESEAFFVRVDSSNNPPEQLERGIVVVEVGLALNRPAEFFILKIVKRRLS